MRQDLEKMYHCAQILFLQEMQSPFMSQLCWQWHLESSRINTTLLISHLTARWVTLFVGWQAHNHYGKAPPNVSLYSSTMYIWRASSKLSLECVVNGASPELSSIYAKPLQL